MGLLSLLSDLRGSRLLHLPKGSFVMTYEGRIMSSTMPYAFPVSHIQEIGQRMLAVLASAKKASVPLNELVVQFSAMKIYAKSLRSGVIVFMMPQMQGQPEKVQMN